MRFDTLKRFSSFLSIALILFISIASKVPTSHCHCHDPKSSQQQKAECPFGQMRALGASTTPSTEFSLKPPLLIASLETLPCGRESALSLDSTFSFEARAPPRKTSTHHY